MTVLISTVISLIHVDGGILNHVVYLVDSDMEWLTDLSFVGPLISILKVQIADITCAAVKAWPSHTHRSASTNFQFSFLFFPIFHIIGNLYRYNRVQIHLPLNAHKHPSFLVVYKYVLVQRCRAKMIAQVVAPMGRGRSSTTTYSMSNVSPCFLATLCFPFASSSPNLPLGCWSPLKLVRS